MGTDEQRFIANRGPFAESRNGGKHRRLREKATVARRRDPRSALIFHKDGLFWLFLVLISHLFAFRAIELNLIRKLEL